MKREQAQTPTRQEWNELSGEIQHDVDDTLERLKFDIEVANSNLKCLYNEDPEAAGEYAQETIEYLDGEWAPYMGHLFMVAGKWYEANPVISDSISPHPRYTEVVHAARSNGFMVAPVMAHEAQREVDEDVGEKADEDEGEDGVYREYSANEELRVGLSFKLGQLSMTSVFMQGTLEFLAFAEPHEVSLQYLRPGTNEVISGRLDQIEQALSSAQALLRAYTGHDGSSFYEQTAKKQEQFIGSLIDSVQEVLPDQATGDGLILKETRVGQVFYRDQQDGMLNNIVSSEEAERLRITGQVIGVTILDRLVQPDVERYDAPGDMLAAETGLCLIVQPTSSNLDPEEIGGSDLVIPINQIHKPRFKLL